MIGVVVVSHSNIGCEMVGATLRIIPEADHIRGVAVESNEPPESIRQRITEAVSQVDRGSGVLILTDMFGGTPSNICLSLLEPSRVEVVSGFNLPMLVKLASVKEDAGLMETAEFIQQYGQRNIVIASRVLAQGR
jgi:PTS system mannose-specific IIA component